MTIQYVYNGAREMCQQWTYQLDFWCHLYVNQVTWTVNTVLADIVEASFPGYHPLPVSGWSPAGIEGGVAVTRSDQVVFTCTADTGLQLVVGFFMTRGNPRRLIMGESRAAGPIPIISTGNNVVVLPQLTLIP